jgi:hypothetical protein
LLIISSFVCPLCLFISLRKPYKKNLKPVSSFALTLILSSYCWRLCLVSQKKKCASIISDLIVGYIKKKGAEKKKLWKKSWKIYLFKCTSSEFLFKYRTRLLSIFWCKILLGFDCNTCILSILLVCIKSEIIFARVFDHYTSFISCGQHLHWSSSLDRDLSITTYRIQIAFLVSHFPPSST